MATAANLPPSLRMFHAWPSADQQEYIERRRRQVDTATLSFRDFVTQVNPRYVWYPHVVQLAAVLQRVADGELDRLMIFMHPRSGKSELVSRLFSAYYLYRYPERWVGLNSYGAELAYTLSRNARENYGRASGQLKGDAFAVKHWETAAGGGLWAAGVGGPITGKGFFLGLIDDPTKNAEEAQSPIVQERHRDWYNSTFYTRAEPGAAVILIMTRWHEYDLAGYLLDKEGEEPENWHVVHMEAIKEDEIPGYPATCTLEPDGRPVGAALVPERYPAEKLRRIQGRVGPYFWASLYQQRPAPREGGMFKREWFDIVGGVPGERVRRVRYWDKAGTRDKAAAYTAGILMAVAGGVYYIEDLIMGQWEAAEREQVIQQTAAIDGKSVEVGVEQEPGSGGKESAENTIKSLPGYVGYTDRPTGDKVTRAEPLAAQAAVRNVKLVRARWNTTLLDILTSFPNGIKDPVDAASGAFARLVDEGDTAVRQGHVRGRPAAGVRRVARRKVAA